MHIFQTVQEEMVEWQRHNFPGRPTFVPLCGMVEEIGELAESAHNEDILDAVGDVFIYMADYCNDKGYDLTRIWDQEQSTYTYGLTLDQVRALQIQIGRLAHAHIKEFQNIRVQEDHPAKAKAAIGRILYHLAIICQIQGTSLPAVVAFTWDKVKKRDWQKNRNTAHLEQQ